MGCTCTHFYVPTHANLGIFSLLKINKFASAISPINKIKNFNLPPTSMNFFTAKPERGARRNKKYNNVKV